MRVGTTSFGYRYELLDESTAPSLGSLVDAAHGLGLEMLQICENARPLAVDEEAWRQVVAQGERLGVEVQIGCKTMNPAVIAAYAERAQATPSRMLRAVLEEEGAAAPPGREEVDELLAAVFPMLKAKDVRLAIENHFDIPSQMLADAVEAYPADRLGFCVDTANSLRNFESPEAVLKLLGPRAFCYHVKDFSVEGHMLGFSITGAPLGSGRLPLDKVMELIPGDADVFLENWVPASGVRAQDIETEKRWLRDSLAGLRSAISRRA